jgi:sulfite reductase (NADPH) flavoprotein alpha-component
MEIARVLETAPFSQAQRGWLDGFLSEMLGLPAAQSGLQSLPMPTLPAVPKSIFSRSHPLESKILAVHSLTGAGSEKDVRLISFDLGDSGLTYNAGDSLGVYPENCPELVDLILAALEARGDERVPTPQGRIVTARDALTRVYTITQTSDQVLSVLGKHATDASEAKRLVALSEDDSDGEVDGMDLLDVLLRFPSARRAPVGDLIAALGPIQPRLYSISSSQCAHPHEVHLTVAVVRYSHTGCDRLRKGVASTFLSERVKADQTARIFVQPAHGFGLPSRTDAPVIMVGPGTGIAPFRAFLQERQATRARGKNWLLFGDQRQATDFLYQQELEAFIKSGVLTHLDTAFSRDQDEKVYVQHRMLEQATRVWEWLQQGAHVYVCGDAKRMARDVDQALHQIVMEQGRMTAADATAYVATLRREKRYQRDVY